MFAVRLAGGAWTVFSSQNVPWIQGLVLVYGREQPCTAERILLPIGKAPRRGREHSQSIIQLVMKSLRGPPTPCKHANWVKNT